MTAIDVLLDIDTLLSSEEIHCQAYHKVEPDDDWEETHPTRPCTHKVVALKTVSCEGTTFFICQNSYEWNLECLDDPKCYCSEDHHIQECWTVRPI